MSRARWILVIVAALAGMLEAASILPARVPSGDAWLLTLRRRPGGDMARPSGAARLWVARAEGAAGTRLLTDGFFSAESPSPSFDGRRFLFVGRTEDGDASEIWEMSVEGPGARRITRGRGDPRHPVYLPDGRILFSDASADSGGGRSLFSCDPDGSDVRRLTFGPHADARPEVLDDGRVRFERVFQPDGQSAGRSEAQSAGYGAVPVPMTIHPDGTGVAGHFGDRPSDGRSPAGAGVPPPAGFEVIAAMRLAARSAPPALTSVLDPARGTGTLLCLDAYSSRLPELAGLPRGAIAKVKVGLAGGQDDVDLGEAPVHPDGSFFIEVPADTPLRLTLVGKDDRALAALRFGLWVRPNENRGCVGCHEPPDLAPENRRPLAVGKAAVPMGGALARGGGADARR